MNHDISKLKHQSRCSSTIQDPARPPRKKALLIAVCSNRDSTDADSPIYTLDGPLKDVEEVKALIIKKFNYPEENICALLDNSVDPRQLPTKDNIIREMNALVHDTRPGDCLLFVFAGHGGQIKQAKDCNIRKREPDGMNEGILPSDATFTNEQSWIIDDKLYEILVEPLSPKCRLVAIFDCCHSGTALDLLHYQCNRVPVPWDSPCFVFYNSDTKGLPSMRKPAYAIKRSRTCLEVLSKMQVLKTKSSTLGKGKSRTCSQNGLSAKVDDTTKHIPRTDTTMSNLSQGTIASSLKKLLPSRFQSPHNTTSMMLLRSTFTQSPDTTHGLPASGSFASGSMVALRKSTHTKRLDSEAEKCACCNLALKNHRHRVYGRIPNELRMVIQQLKARLLVRRVVAEEVEVTKNSTVGRSRATSFATAPTVGSAVSIFDVMAQANPTTLGKKAFASSTATTPGSSRKPTCTCNCHLRSTKRKGALPPPPLATSPEPSSPRDLHEDPDPIHSSARSTPITTGHSLSGVLNATKRGSREYPGSILSLNSSRHFTKDEVSSDFRRSWATLLSGNGGFPILRTASPEELTPQEGMNDGIERRMSESFGFHPLHQGQQTQLHSHSTSHPNTYTSFDEVLTELQTSRNAHPPDNTKSAHSLSRIMHRYASEPIHTSVNMETRIGSHGDSQRDDKCDGTHEPRASEGGSEVYSIAACRDYQEAFENSKGRSLISFLVNILEEDPHPSWFNLMRKLKCVFFKHSQERFKHDLQLKIKQAEREKNRRKRREERRKKREEQVLGQEKASQRPKGSESEEKSVHVSSSLSVNSTNGRMLSTFITSASKSVSTKSMIVGGEVGAPELSHVTETSKTHFQCAVVEALGTTALGEEEEVKVGYIVQQFLSERDIQDPVLGSMAPIDLNRNFSL